MKTKQLIIVTVAALAAFATLSAHGRTISANYTLTQDEDWTDDGTVQIENAATIDLNGHNLTVAGVQSGVCITNAAGVVAGYSDLKFLDTSGSQRIQTDFKPQDSDVVYMGVKFHSGSAATQMLWCDRAGNTENTFSAARISGVFRFDRRASSTMTGTQYEATDDVYYDIVANYLNCECTVNGESAASMNDTAAFTPPTNLVLFASFTISSAGAMTSIKNYADLRFYYFKVMRGGSLVAHFVPALRQSDGTVGVYDRVAGKFYENAGTGVFTAEGEVTITNSASGEPAKLNLDIAPHFQALDYIQPTGKQFIQTDYTPAANDRVEMKFNFTKVNVNQFLICSRTSSSSKDYFGVVILKTSSDTITYRYFRFDIGQGMQSFKDYEVKANTDYTIVADGKTRKLTVNDEEWGPASDSAATPTKPFQLFASGYPVSTTNNWAYGKCYYFRVYDSSGALKVDMIPARRDDGVYGMYDRVSDKFYSSASATAFAANGATTQGAVGRFVNDTVSFTGNMKVVKKGTGTYVAAIAGQTYTGGTEVSEGLFVCGWPGSSNPLGADSSALVITTNGTFDINGKLNLNNYAFVLAGGMVTNSVDQATVYNNNCIGDLALTADSSLVTGGRYALSQKTNGVWYARLDLDGHKLTIKTPTAFYFRGVDAVSSGTIELHGPRLIQFIGNDSDIRKVNIVVADGGQIRASTGRGVKLGGYVSDAEAQDDSDDYGGKFELYGTFKPNTDYFHGLELQDGATIDLSGRTTPLPCQSLIGTNCVANAKNLTFADNAMIRVTWNGRTIPTRQPLIMWTAETKPANLDTLTFVRDAGESILPLMKLNDGVYQSKGLSITFR